MTAPFSGRGEAARANWSRREGGTVHSEKAVEMALDWFARHQRADGGWALNYHSQCQGDGCPPGVSLESETAATGLALLPMLGRRSYPHQKDALSAQCETGARLARWPIKPPTATSTTATAAPPTFTAMPSAQWRFARRMDFHMTHQLRITRKRPSISSPARKSGRRRLAVFSRPTGRHLRLWLADVRTPQRAAVRLERPRACSQRVSQVS